MTARRSTELRPGYGDHVTIRSSTSGRSWTGIVLVWSLGCPFVSDDETAEKRWYPASWVESVVEGNGPGPCECPEPFTLVPNEGTPPVGVSCEQHADPSAVAALILKRARTKP